MAALLVLFVSQVQAQESMLGEIRMFAGNFAPRGWAFCDGQLLSVADNTALFSLLSNTYGGDGRTTFGLPDLRNTAPVHYGARPGDAMTAQGERTQGGLTAGADPNTPESDAIRTPHILRVSFIIALEGYYPSRS